MRAASNCARKHTKGSVRKKETIFGTKWQFVCGQKVLQSTCCGSKFFVAPHSFLQINNSVRDEMFAFVASQIENEVVVEGYSGAGLLSVILSKKAKEIFAIEINPSASKDAEKTCKINGCTNVHTKNGDFSAEFEKLSTQIRFNTLVVDPPRSGCSKEVLQTIKKCLPQKIVYISCNPYTLKQNLNLVMDEYKIECFHLFDIFPQTFDIESVVVLKKRT